MARFSTDNLSCMTVRFQKDAFLESQNNRDNPIGVESDAVLTSGKISESEKIVDDVRKHIAEGGTVVGVSASNNGKGHDPVLHNPTEEPQNTDGEIERQSRKTAAEPDSVKGKQ